MRINLVVAMAENGVIGRGGALPWALPADLSRFKQITLGFPLIMGRLTHESIGRPLPGRMNIVVSRTPNYAAAGCVIVPSFGAALVHVGAVEEVMVIGGRALYAAALPRTERIYLTEVHARIDGNVVFPEFVCAEWREIQRERHTRDARNGHDYSFVILDRVSAVTR
ncbi:MAG: dihydrofolate reductase [Gammaproteobacteria bacterium]|nr:dihydrofolate reductase [Gammaproteobacteria bacterium]